MTAFPETKHIINPQQFKPRGTTVKNVHAEQNKR